MYASQPLSPFLFFLVHVHPYPHRYPHPWAPRVPKPSLVRESQPQFSSSFYFPLHHLFPSLSFFLSSFSTHSFCQTILPSFSSGKGTRIIVPLSSLPKYNAWPWPLRCTSPHSRALFSSSQFSL